MEKETKENNEEIKSPEDLLNYFRKEYEKNPDNKFCVIYKDEISGSKK